MSTKKINTVLIVILMIAVFGKISDATTINVSVANFSFTPANINAVVGDTIKWNWVSGGHTTTCDGSNGTSRPSGAAPWDSDIDNGSPTFRYKITVAGSYHYVCVPHAPNMSGNINVVATSITQLNSIVTGYELSQNFPNPFNPSTKINFSIPASSNVVLKIYNELGKEIETLVNQNLNAGEYQAEFNAADLSSGIYYYRIETSDFVLTRKMLLVK